MANDHKKRDRYLRHRMLVKGYHRHHGILRDNNATKIGNVPIIRGSVNPRVRSFDTDGHVRTIDRPWVRVRVRVRVIGLDYRTLGLSNPRINKPSDCRPIIQKRHKRQVQTSCINIRKLPHCGKYETIYHKTNQLGSSVLWRCWLSDRQPIGYLPCKSHGSTIPTRLLFGDFWAGLTPEKSRLVKQKPKVVAPV